MAFRFELQKYMGRWYELIHYPSWFQRNDNYNTMAEYTPMKDGRVQVHNSTVTQGKVFDSYGAAVWMGDMSFRVDFAKPEVDKLVRSQQFQMPMHSESMHQNAMHPKGIYSEGMHSEGMHPKGMYSEGMHPKGMYSEGMHSKSKCQDSMYQNEMGPNYVIDKIWTNCQGDYIFAVVTDPERDSLYVLSRYPNPSLIAYSQIMEYVVANYDRDRLVQTPHFH